jgi:hypothetical protein
MWMEHAMKAQKLASSAKRNNDQVQKTSEKSTPVASVTTTNAMNSQRLMSKNTSAQAQRSVAGILKKREREKEKKNTLLLKH